MSPQYSIDLNAFFDSEFLMPDENAPPTVHVSKDVRKARLRAQVAQAQRISAARKKQDVAPHPGKIWLERHSCKRVSLKEAFLRRRPQKFSPSEVRWVPVGFSSRKSLDESQLLASHLKLYLLVENYFRYSCNSACLVLENIPILWRVHFCSTVLESQLPHSMTEEKSVIARLALINYSMA
jgi:hypothetical protein